MKRMAIFVLTVAALGVAGPSGALAQTAAQDQYSAAQDQYSAVPDPYSAAPDPYLDGGAVSPPVPSSSQQTTQYLAQYLQQLLYTQQAAAYLEQLLAAAAPPTGQVGLAAGIDPGLASVAPGIASILIEGNCNLNRTWTGAPDGSDPNAFGHDPGWPGISDFSDVAEACSM